MKPIWIVDDDQSIRFVLEKALLREGLSTRSFTNPREVLVALASEDGSEGPQVLVSDIRMPGGSGLDLLTQVKQQLPALPVIIMTAFSDLDSAVSAFQNGAFEYLPKPFDLPKAIELIRRALEESQREEVAEELMADTPEMLGQAPAMQDVFRAIGRLSQSNVTVMITGESGSGKELVARALHKHSPRASGPFVAINTAAIPKDLLESELFGHERGAFTGAQTSRRGRFEQAEGGSRFGTTRQGRCFPRRLVSSLECDSFALASFARAQRGCSGFDQAFPVAKCSTTGCGAQAYFRTGSRNFEPISFSRQCSPIGEHLSLAHRHGACAND